MPRLFVYSSTVNEYRTNCSVVSGIIILNLKLQIKKNQTRSLKVTSLIFQTQVRIKHQVRMNKASSSDDHYLEYCLIFFSLQYVYRDCNVDTHLVISRYQSLIMDHRDVRVVRHYTPLGTFWRTFSRKHFPLP